MAGNEAINLWLIDWMRLSSLLGFLMGNIVNIWDI